MDNRTREILRRPEGEQRKETRGDPDGMARDMGGKMKEYFSLRKLSIECLTNFYFANPPKASMQSIHIYL